MSIIVDFHKANWAAVTESIYIDENWERAYVIWNLENRVKRLIQAWTTNAAARIQYSYLFPYPGAHLNSQTVANKCIQLANLFNVL